MASPSHRLLAPLRRTFAVAALVTCWAATVHGQDVAPAALPATASDFSAFVPIHTQADDPDGGAYGVWAAGDGFKASFGAGTLTFHPVGSGDQHWRWTTESIGGFVVTASALEAAPTRFTPDRFETQHDMGVVEAYDLLDGGIEQSFVFPNRPEGLQGDLQIVGRIDSPWFAAESTGAHAELLFTSVDTAGIRYGKAFAVDAAGRRLELATTWDGTRITLTVPAAFAAEASYPLVVDPVVYSGAVHNDTMHRYPITSVDVVRDDARNQIYYAVTEEVSARDDDLRLYTCNDDFSNPQLVFADITTSWSTEHANVATIGGAGKCVTAFHRIFGTTEHALRWHVRDVADRVMSTGYGFLSTPSDQHDWLADVGGSRTGTTGSHALLVWQRDISGTRFANTSSSMAMYALLDVTGTGQGVLATPARLQNPGTGFDQEHPSATPMAEGGTNSGWPVVWQEWGNLRGTSQFAWDGKLRRVNIANGGTLSTGVAFLRPTITQRAHCLRPTIAGDTGRYLVSFAELALSITSGKTDFPQGNLLAADRIDWPSNRSSPSFPHVPVRRFSRGDRRYVNGGIAYDHDSRSHWVTTAVDTVLDSGFAEKLGYRGRLIAYGALGTYSNFDPIPGGVTYDDDNGRFALGHGRQNPVTLGWSANGHLFTYDFAHPPTPYGVGCTSTGAVPGWDGTWYAGDEFAAATLTNAPTGTPGVLRFGSYPRQTPLLQFGMPGCFLHLDISRMWAMSAPITTSRRGGARVSLPLPEEYRPSDLYMQWFLLEPGANANGVTATPGLGMRIVE